MTLALQTAPAASRFDRPTTLERAFELARSGACATLADIAAVLKREWHEAVDAHLAGPSVRRDLRRACEAAAA